MAIIHYDRDNGPHFALMTASRSVFSDYLRAASLNRCVGTETLRWGLFASLWLLPCVVLDPWISASPTIALAIRIAPWIVACVGVQSGFVSATMRLHAAEHEALPMLTCGCSTMLYAASVTWLTELCANAWLPMSGTLDLVACLSGLFVALRPVSPPAVFDRFARWSRPKADPIVREYVCKIDALLHTHSIDMT
ncbi:MAG TPA: hypothetical protein DCQ06_09070 [Myxococcales bacterium]|nr:hypothetical protein [Myxococcales bacterium]